MAVYSFGFGKFGQLGQVTESSDHTDPVIVSALKGKRVVSVSCGESHSLAITEYGDLYSWGRGREGQLGHGTRDNSNEPRAVEKLSHERIVRGQCGHSHSVALTDTGKVYNWGKVHKLLDDVEMAAKPTRYYGIGVENPGERTQDMLQRSHLEYLSGTISEEGDEAPNQDQLEQIQLGQEFGRFANFTQTTPMFVEALRGKKIVEIAAGYACTAAITDSGQLYMWGFNEKGQLGLGHRFNSDVPRLVHSLNDIRLVGVACGSHHTVALDEHGHVYSWGLGVFGQLGHGNLDDLRQPKRIEYLVQNGIVVVQVVCGAYHTVARTSKGELYSFGHGEYGQHGGVANYSDWGSGESAGKEAHLQNSIPRLVKGFDGTKVLFIACGQLHSAAVTENNQVFTWGWGAGGCLGHGDMRYQLVPRLVTSLQGEDILSAAAGWKHTLVIKSGTISTFAFDFKPAINNPKYSDITFIVQGKKVHAHKVIVCARCPYIYVNFLIHARFVGNGHLPTEFKIKNVRLPIFMALLNYLYTDHLICPAHLSKELGLVAARFKLPRLESLCKRADYRAWARVGEAAPMILPSAFCAEMSQMVTNKHYSDLEFTLDTGEAIRAHKVILAARSSYFHRMFEGNFKERDQNTFNCDEGQTVSSFSSFLAFLYTGDQEIVQSDNAVELLGLADRMIVDDLKQLCEYFLERLVSSSYLSLIADAQLDNNEDVADACENTVALLEIGDKYEAKRLKRVCLEAICGSGEKNWKLLSEKQAFKELRQSSPLLFRELDYLASKNGLIADNQMFFKSK